MSNEVARELRKRLKDFPGLPKETVFRFLEDMRGQMKELTDIAVAAVRLVNQVGEAQAPELARTLRKGRFLPGDPK